MKILTLTLGSALTLIALAVAIRQRVVQPEEQTTGERIVPAEELMKGRPIGIELSRKSIPPPLMYISPTFKQTVFYGAAYDAADPTRLLVMNYSDISLFEPDATYEFSASFEIVNVVPRTRDHFYIIGRSGIGEDIIERWKKANLGGGGGEYLMQRKEIFRGMQLAGIKEVGVDHLGRFLLVIHATPNIISKIELPDGQPITIVYNVTQVPALATMSTPTGLFPRLHPTEGLVWTLEGFDFTDPGARILFYDQDDNGTLDAWTAFSEASYYSQYSPDDWLDDFVWH